MPDSLKDLEAEKDRLHGAAFNGIVAMVDSKKMVLRIKDSRSTERGGHPGDLNQALLIHGYRPGSTHDYSLAQSLATFV